MGTRILERDAAHLGAADQGAAAGRAAVGSAPMPADLVATTAAGRVAVRRRQRKVSRTGPRSLVLPARPVVRVAADHAGQLRRPAGRMGQWARLATTVTVLLAVGTLTLTSIGSGAASTTQLERVTVRSGDTLWSIATRAQPEADPRVVIEQITELNGLRGQVLPVGVVLQVPSAG